MNGLIGILIPEPMARIAVSGVCPWRGLLICALGKLKVVVDYSYVVRVFSVR